MKCDQLQVFIGWDSKEPAAAAVLAHSILTRAEKPVWIMPLTRKAVSHLYTRPRGPLESTEFSMTRFLVPYLSGYEGWSLFLDCDMLCRTNIWDVMLYPLVDPGKAVYVAQHPDYTPVSGDTKFLGQPQTSYPRKNWSSVMLFDNARCQRLTPDYVNTASGKDLHQFAWLDGGVVPGVDMVTITGTDASNWTPEGRDAYIGNLPLEWNWLVGQYAHNDAAKILHYTDGTPCLPGYEACDHADLWHAERAAMLGEGAA